MNKGLEKEIDYLRDAKAQMWILALGTFGGSFSLMFSNVSLFFKVPIVIIGGLLSYIFFENYFQKGDKIENTIKILNKLGESHDP